MTPAQMQDALRLVALVRLVARISQEAPAPTVVAVLERAKKQVK